MSKKKRLKKEQKKAAIDIEKMRNLSGKWDKIINELDVIDEKVQLLKNP